MKHLLTAVLISLTTGAIAQEQKKMSGMFEGYSHGTYSFSDENEEYLNFDDVDPEILKQWNLNSDDLLYESFDLIYIVTENEDGDKIYKIVGVTHIEE